MLRGMRHMFDSQRHRVVSWHVRLENVKTCLSWPGNLHLLRVSRTHTRLSSPPAGVKKLIDARLGDNWPPHMWLIVEQAALVLTKAVPVDRKTQRDCWWDPISSHFLAFFPSFCLLHRAWHKHPPLHTPPPLQRFLSVSLTFHWLSCSCGVYSEKLLFFFHSQSLSAVRPLKKTQHVSLWALSSHHG